MDQILSQLEKLRERVDVLDRNSIKIALDPEVYKILNGLITTVATSIATTVATSVVASALATRPTQTYSGGAPSGTPPIGSVWFEDTGVLATRKIWVYSGGGGWVQFK